MESRRRIAFHKAQELRPLAAAITAGICDAWNGVFEGMCEARVTSVSAKVGASPKACIFWSSSVDGCGSNGQAYRCFGLGCYQYRTQLS
jgi:hypothetical protein